MSGLGELLSRYPALAECREDIERARDAITAVYRAGGKLLLCGNGGSAADCEHITGELTKGFLEKRPLPVETREKLVTAGLSESAAGSLQRGLPAISLPGLVSLDTATANDIDPELIFAQGVVAFARPGDALICISTSGNARNVNAAALTAKALGVGVVALTGAGGGRLKSAADITVAVPETETYRVQELHLPVYHYLCAAVERELFGGSGGER